MITGTHDRAFPQIRQAASITESWAQNTRPVAQLPRVVAKPSCARIASLPIMFAGVMTHGQLPQFRIGTAWIDRADRFSRRNGIHVWHRADHQRTGYARSRI